MQTVEKSALLNGANIIAAQQFTVLEWHILVSVLVLPSCLLLQGNSGHAWLIVRVACNITESAI